MDYERLLDPELAEGLAAFPLDLGSLSAEMLPPIRGGLAAVGEAMAASLSDGVTRTDHPVPGHDGVVVRVHRPVGHDEPLPCVYWMHGGGYVIGNARMDDARFDRWCQLFPCVAVSVDYRLAPETPYPGPLDDCDAGLRWVREHAAELGIDTSRMGIGGASAGAGLAAGLALRLRDLGDADLTFLHLIYPMIDDSMTSESSAWPDPVWPPAANVFGWSSYLGDLMGGDVPYCAAPARAVDLTALPPTFIAVGALDVFADEDIELAVRLRHAGVPTELHVYPGAPHGFHSLAPTSEIVRRANRDEEEWLQTFLA